jgi:hypothetical protein
MLDAVHLENLDESLFGGHAHGDLSSRKSVGLGRWSGF